MTRGVDDAHGTLAKMDDITVFQVNIRGERQSVSIRGMDANRCLCCFFDCLKGTDMVKMTMRNENMFNR